MVPADLWWIPPLLLSSGVLVELVRQLAASRPLVWADAWPFILAASSVSGSIWLTCWVSWGGA